MANGTTQLMDGSNMLPCFSKLDVFNCASADTESMGNAILRIFAIYKGLFDLLNFLIGQFVPPMFRSLCAPRCLRGITRGYPEFVFHYSGNGFSRNSKLSSQVTKRIGSGGKNGPNRLDLIFGQFTARMLLFAQVFCSAFSIPVVIVVFYGAKEKVIWPHARRVVAFVKHAKAVWNRAIMYLPRKVMSFHIMFVRVKSTIIFFARSKIPASSCEFSNSIPEFSDNYFIHKQETRRSNRLIPAHDGRTIEAAGKLSFMLRAVSTLAIG